MFQINPTDIVLVGIAKYENDYIEEWVDYHFKIGFDKIYLFDDGDGDVPYLSDLDCLRKYILNEKLFIERCGDIDAPQLKMYNKFYKKNNFFWAFFLDIDEFFTMTNKWQTVRQYITKDCFQDADLVVFNWLLYGDNNQIYYEKSPVIERFPEPQEAAFENPNPMIVKCAVRKSDIPFSFPNPHSADFRPREFVVKNASGQKLSMTDEYDPCIATAPIDYKYAYIRHYFTKSMEEFLTKKLRRTSPCRVGDVSRKVSAYWIANKKTPEKEKIFNDFIDKLEKEKNFSFNKTEEEFKKV